MSTSAAIVVALDFPESAPALDLAARLKGVVPWVKVGLELYLAAGSAVLAQLKDMGFLVFLDLKFMDIPNTVHAAVRQATLQGADMITLHTLGGEAMCRAALTGRAEERGTGNGPILLGVTLLTSLGPADLVWNSQSTPADLESLTLDLARRAQNWDLDGVVCSGREVRAIRQACGASFQILTPGIRLPQADAGDQSRVCTPDQARRDGSNFLVIGRPITTADDPVHTAHMYSDQTE